MLRSLRFRLTVAATIFLVVVLAGAAVFIVRTVDSELRSDIAKQIDATLDEVTAKIEAGDNPEDIEVTAPTDGSLLEIRDANDEIVTSTLSGIVYYDVFGNEIEPDVEARYENPTEWTETVREATAPDGATYSVYAFTPQTILEVGVGQVRSVLWLVIPILAVTFALGAWFTISRTLKPVSKMTAEARRISTDTIGDRLPTPGSGDEIDELATTLNGMLSRLDQGVQKQRQFVSDASHELRSPLTAMIGEATLADEYPTMENLQHSNAVTLAEGQRLADLVADLLALSLSDQTALKMEDVDLDDIALEQASLTRNGVDVADISPVRIRGNRSTLTRVIRNLLDNAARHAQASVAISTHTDGANAVIIVDDDGPGIPIEDRETVFERFVRLDEGRARDAGGSGIGLALAKAIVESHGGSITIADSPTGGARFTVALPHER